VILIWSGRDILREPRKGTLIWVKGASIISGFLKGAYKFIWIGYEYKVGGPVDYNFIAFSRCTLDMSPEEIRNKYRPFDIARFLRKTIYTENTRGEYRSLLVEGSGYVLGLVGGAC
jgi:hypothetical protein